jgi:hypothetical protein
MPAHVVPDPEFNGHDPASTEIVGALERLARLRDAGALSDTEFQVAKERLLG